jgi:2-amino-4-hydroxy-6-hydroxymethyldihydropteridine diphosphokinase
MWGLACENTQRQGANGLSYTDGGLQPWVVYGASSFVPMEQEALLLLGADLGDRPKAFAAAGSLLQERGINLLASSRDHETEPWGMASTALFLNRALRVRTALPPKDLLAVCLAVELGLGRQRTGEATPASRPIDIDLLLYGAVQLKEPGLEVPHPRLHERAFALAPAADVAPEWYHPGLGLTVLQLLQRCSPTWSPTASGTTSLGA